jgi:hypothetical protein
MSCICSSEWSPQLQRCSPSLLQYQVLNSVRARFITWNQQKQSEETHFQFVQNYEAGPLTLGDLFEVCNPLLSLAFGPAFDNNLPATQQDAAVMTKSVHIMDMWEHTKYRDSHLCLHVAVSQNRMLDSARCCYMSYRQGNMLRNFLTAGSFWKDCAHPIPRINIPWPEWEFLTEHMHQKTPKAYNNWKWILKVPSMAPQWKLLSISLKIPVDSGVFRILGDISQHVLITFISRNMPSSQM